MMKQCRIHHITAHRVVLIWPWDTPSRTSHFAKMPVDCARAYALFDMTVTRRSHPQVSSSFVAVSLYAYYAVNPLSTPRPSIWILDSWPPMITPWCYSSHKDQFDIMRSVGPDVSDKAITGIRNQWPAKSHRVTGQILAVINWGVLESWSSFLKSQHGRTVGLWDL